MWQYIEKYSRSQKDYLQENAEDRKNKLSGDSKNRNIYGGDSKPPSGSHSSVYSQQQALTRRIFSMCFGPLGRNSFPKWVVKDLTRCNKTHPAKSPGTRNYAI